MKSISATIPRHYSFYESTSRTHDFSVVAAINAKWNPETKKSCKTKQTNAPRICHTPC